MPFGIPPNQRRMRVWYSSGMNAIEHSPPTEEEGRGRDWEINGMNAIMVFPPTECKRVGFERERQIP